jgi:hypothetical protein
MEAGRLMLQSYLQDTWVSPSGASEPPADVRDAVTGDVICQVSSAGLDLAAAFRHARHDILISADPQAPAPHEVEPFGPVASVLGYRDAAHAAELLARGRGSLAASLVSDDVAWTAAFLAEAAPWHGRLHLLDSTDMDQTTGHGSPLPALRHGGPGRAGAGSEMAGIRGVLDLMQRTAIQASPDLLAALQSRPSYTTNRASEGRVDGIRRAGTAPDFMVLTDRTGCSRPLKMSMTATFAVAT